MFEAEPLDLKPTVRPRSTKPSGVSRSTGWAPRCRRAETAAGGSNGDSTRTSWPLRRSSSDSASTCRVTPPGYVHEYGDTSAMRTCPWYRPILRNVASRHFVKYTFLQVDAAWRRLDAEERAEHKREFLAACEDFGTDHLLQ